MPATPFTANPHRPDGKMADMPESTLILQLDRSLVLSEICTCQPRLQNPIAQMGKWLTCLPRLTLAQLRTLRSTTVCMCRKDLEKFPSPRWEFLLTCPN